MTQKIYKNRDNVIRYRVKINNQAPPEPITRAVIAIGGLVFDSDVDSEVSVTGSGTITAQLGFANLDPMVYRLGVTVYTASDPNGLETGSHITVAFVDTG